MNKYLLLLVLPLFLSNCSDDPTPSPFEEFIGTWQLESRIQDGFEETLLANEVMNITEDLDPLDNIAIGYYEDGDPVDRVDLELRKTETIDEIILIKKLVTFNCTYQFNGADQFQLTDFFETENSEIVTTWNRVD